jgi:signal peptidase I
MKINLIDFAVLKKNLKPNTEVQVLTSSMEPFFYKTDKIVVSPISVSEIKVGDAIVYWHNDKLICHLVYQIRHNIEVEFLTKGINNKHFDLPIKSQQILGIVVNPQISFWQRILFRFYIRLKSIFGKMR